MKQTAAATQRNREPILEVLRRILPSAGTVLEIASGSGEHAVHFAARLPHLTWQPSDPDAVARDSIAAWRDEAQAPNLLPPLPIDVRHHPWPIASADAVVCINMIHIAPWTTCEALLRGAATLLAPGGPLYLYGPFLIDGRFTAPSNAAFDRELRRHNPEWGVRDLAEVRTAARRHGFRFVERVDMPANNFSVLFAKDPA